MALNLWREPRSTLSALWFFCTIVPRLVIFAIGIAAKERR